MLPRTLVPASLVAFMLAAASPAATQDQPPLGAYKAVGSAALVNCQHFVVEMGKGAAADQVLGTSVMGWVWGYITAYNATLARAPQIMGDLSKGITELELINWIADWCSAHPAEVIATATRELVMHLYQRSR